MGPHFLYPPLSFFFQLLDGPYLFVGASAVLDGPLSDRPILECGMHISLRVSRKKWPVGGRKFCFCTLALVSVRVSTSNTQAHAHAHAHAAAYRWAFDPRPGGLPEGTQFCPGPSTAR
jgi:hypothetical protein